jgi:hypothetical protein
MEAYSFEPDRKEMGELVGKDPYDFDTTHIQVQFDHMLESAKSFRALKHAIGGELEVYGDSGSMLQSPMLCLAYGEDEQYFLKIHWAGAYLCEPTTKYHCVPVAFADDKDVTVETHN